MCKCVPLLSCCLLLLLVPFTALRASLVTYAFNPLTILPNEDNEFLPAQSTVLSDQWQLVKVSGDPAAPLTNGTVTIAIDPVAGAYDYIGAQYPAYGSNVTSINPSFDTTLTVDSPYEWVDWEMQISNIPPPPLGYTFSPFTIDASGEAWNGSGEIDFQDGSTMSSVPTNPNDFQSWATRIYANPWENEVGDPGSSPSSIITISVTYDSIPEPSTALIIGLCLASFSLLRKRQS